MTSMVDYLLKSGANVNGSGKEGDTALYLASEKGHNDVYYERTVADEVSVFLRKHLQHSVLTMKALANHIYTLPWDANKIWGCVCDIGSRGPDCSLNAPPQLTLWVVLETRLGVSVLDAGNVNVNATLDIMVQL
eukprot:gene25807-32301_t